MKFKRDIQFTIAPKTIRGINSTIDMKIFSLKTIEKYDSVAIRGIRKDLKNGDISGLHKKTRCC